MAFLQSGQHLESWVKITDRTTPSSNAFFNGSPVYCYGADMTYALQVIKATKSIPMPSMPNFVNTTGSGIGGSWNDMKGPTSFAGIENPKVNLSCSFSTDLVNTSTDRYLMNPYIAILFATSGRRFYLEDERIINSINTWDTNGSYVMYELGMPFTIDSVQFRADARSDKNIVNINFAITEDKE